MRRRAWTAVAALAAGVACLSVAGTRLAMARYPPPAFGATVGPPVAPAVTSQAEGPSTTTATTPRLAGRPTRAAAPVGDPVRLAIPALHEVARVQPVTSTGSVLPVPEDPHLVGWWTSSARPGAPEGTVVMDGHVDSAREGPGALFRLTELHAGDSLVVTTTSQQVPYRVIGRRVYTKATGLPRDLFEASLSPRLVLISCGGPFDQQTGSYEDNIVVYAVPL